MKPEFFEIPGPEAVTPMDDMTVSKIYGAVTKKLSELGLKITTMESCTGGMISSFLTDAEGASATTDGAFTTYSNGAKTDRGVPADTIGRFGVYSEETAEAMATACAEAFNADIGIGITGTFANLDENNGDSVERTVYACIYGTRRASWKKETHKYELPDMGEGYPRHGYKLMVAVAVAYALFEFLGMETRIMDHGEGGNV